MNKCYSINKHICISVIGLLFLWFMKQIGNIFRAWRRLCRKPRRCLTELSGFSEPFSNYASWVILSVYTVSISLSFKHGKYLLFLISIVSIQCFYRFGRWLPDFTNHELYKSCIESMLPEFNLTKVRPSSALQHAYWNCASLGPV